MSDLREPPNKPRKHPYEFVLRPSILMILDHTQISLEFRLDTLGQAT